MQNVGNRIEVEILIKEDNEKLNKQKSKLTFDGIHKPNYASP